MTKKTVIRYVVSSLLTFLTGVCATLLVDIDSITLDSFKDGTIVGVIFIAVRAGFKALLEWFINNFANVDKE